MDISPSDFFSCNLELLCNCGMRQKAKRGPGVVVIGFYNSSTLSSYLYRQHNHNRKKQFFLLFSFIWWGEKGPAVLIYIWIFGQTETLCIEKQRGELYYSDEWWWTIELSKCSTQFRNRLFFCFKLNRLFSFLCQKRKKETTFLLL